MLSSSMILDNDCIRKWLLWFGITNTGGKASSRKLFILREINGESSEEICREHGISSSNLHVIMHRARLALCQCLNDLGYAGGRA